MKVFGIGLSNTGTTSLAKALEILGYRSVHYPWSLQEIAEHEAAVDIPVACRYQELDKQYPGSKFILTTRPFEEWIDRRRRKPADRGKVHKWMLDTRKRMYGSTTFDEKSYTEAYHRHHAAVQDYFKDRPDDLLVLPLESADKWEKLCSFLGKEVPAVSYPWEKVEQNIKMKAIYLVPRRLYLKKMSRVRFHQIEEIAKLCDLTYSGNGWSNYRDEETVTQNLKRIYNGGMPDFIIGFDHRAMKEFNRCKVPKITMMNEMHDPEGNQEAGLNMLKSAGYDFIICHHKNEMESKVFDHLRDRMVHLPHHVNLSIFKDYGFDKEIDVLLGGALFLEKYELRRKFVKVIDILKGRGVNAVIHKHPMGEFNDSHTNKYLIDFAKKINASKICLTCSSTLKCAYGKYSEIPACNTLLAGDIPGEREDFFRSFMLELNVEQSETEMADIIQRMLEDRPRLQYLTKLGYIKTQAYDMKNYAKLFMAHVEYFLKTRSAVPR